MKKSSLGFYQNFELHSKFIFPFFLFNVQNGLVFEKLTISPKRIGYFGSLGKKCKIVPKSPNRIGYFWFVIKNVKFLKVQNGLVLCLKPRKYKIVPISF